MTPRFRSRHNTRGLVTSTLCKLLLLCVLTLIAACSGTEDEPDLMCQDWFADAKPCNGSTEYCNRRFNEVSYVTTHNSMSNEDDEWFGPNQKRNMKSQLFDGVRAFMIDTHYNSETENRAPSLCHGGCILGAIELGDALAIFENFLRCNPNQVVAFIVEAYISPEDTKQAFEDAGLLDYVYAHNKDQPWPTLQELIDNNTRLIVLSDDGEADGWYMNVWDHAFETPFSADNPDDLICTLNRGDAGNDLFILNHFLTTILGSEELAEKVNFNPFFSERVVACQNEFMRLPNFVTVDFYSIGDVFKVTKILNDSN